MLTSESLAYFLPRRYLHFLTAHNSRKIKNKIGCSFFASFERAAVSIYVTDRCGVLSESVQFFAKKNTAFLETLHGNSYAFKR